MPSNHDREITQATSFCARELYLDFSKFYVVWGEQKKIDEMAPN